jgi:filamentous hemagglutinin family protein
MQVRNKLFMVPLALAALAGCGDDPLGAGDLELADLQGTWTVQSAEYTADSGDDQYDLIADGDATGTATVSPAGAYTVVYQVNQFTSNYSGTIALGDQSATLTLTSPSGVTVNGGADIELDGDQLTIRFENARYDFEDDDQGEVNADLVWVWQKND